MWRRLGITNTNQVKWNTNVRNLTGSRRKTVERMTNMRGKKQKEKEDDIGDPKHSYNEFRGKE